MDVVRLKAGREKALLRGHPWIYSGAVGDTEIRESGFTPGNTVKIEDASGEFLAWGAYSPESQIRIRVWSRNMSDVIDKNFLYNRLSRAIELRKGIIEPSSTSAYRLVHAESDGLPGFIVDRYGDILVLQCLSCGAEFWRNTLATSLVEITGCERIYERSDAEVRSLEGLSPRRGPIIGGDEFDHLIIREEELKYFVDIRKGHKTGFYLDQRINRSLVRKLAAGKMVLDCFSYTGGFSVSALHGGAEKVVSVESSTEALELHRKNLELNSCSKDLNQLVQGDVFNVLRTLRDKGDRFDLIILDPPKFAPTAAHVQRAARGYKDINLLALKLLDSNGLLITFSCSGGIDEALFQKILAGAALDADVDAKILSRLQPGPDHPVALNFPEGSYLKGFLIQV
jgi:23S rRNA (cytosine1962-C5)-methyltransferase